MSGLGADRRRTSANAFLSHVVPMIQASNAYRQGGLIVITFDEGTSNKTCCGEAIFSTGGGQIGHLAHAGDPSLVPLTRELTATANPCAGPR